MIVKKHLTGLTGNFLRVTFFGEFYLFFAASRQIASRSNKQFFIENL